MKICQITVYLFLNFEGNNCLKRMIWLYLDFPEGLRCMLWMYVSYKTANKLIFIKINVNIRPKAPRAIVQSSIAIQTLVVFTKKSGYSIYSTPQSKLQNKSIQKRVNKVPTMSNPLLCPVHPFKWKCKWLHFFLQTTKSIVSWEVVNVHHTVLRCILSWFEHKKGESFSIILIRFYCIFRMDGQYMIVGSQK